ncbi:MAG: helix-hairpin-helix domain-containing protein [Bacteroidota bacterium]
MPAPPKWSFAYYTRKQQRALWIILAVLVTVFGWSMWPRQELETLPTDDEFWLAVEKLRANEETEEITEAESSGNYYSNSSPSSFYFDPNTVSQQQLEDLGLSERQAKAWVKYRSSGAKFKKPEDIARLRILRPEDVNRLKPLVRISGREYANSDDQADAVEASLRSASESFRFDPNTVTQDELERLGLNVGQARAWIRYRSSGATFGKPEDIARLRVLDAEDVARLQPLVDIEGQPQIADLQASEDGRPQTYGGTTGIGEGYTVNENISLDINAATPEDWQRLRGIGPYWAGRIIKFRDALGGFVSIDQIADTYGFPDSTFQAIRPSLRLEQSVSLLPINLASEDELKHHPYLKARQARAIVAYREQHGPFADANALKDVRLLSEADRERLVPYLSFE